MSQLIKPDNGHICAPQKPPRALRLVLLSMITVCGVLMIGIVVSQPSVTSKFRFDAEHVSSQNDTQGTYGKAAPVLSVGSTGGSNRASAFSSAEQSIAQQIQRKASGHLPRDRVPVRRNGIISGN